MLNITKNANGANLEMALSGRLDTTTAPEFDQAISSSIEGVTSLKLDFSQLEYISSAGLRVLLTAQKTMNKQGSMVVCNVNDTIKEVFEVTGFDGILTVK